MFLTSFFFVQESFSVWQSEVPCTNDQERKNKSVPCVCPVDFQPSGGPSGSFCTHCSEFLIPFVNSYGILSRHSSCEEPSGEPALSNKEILPCPDAVKPDETYGCLCPEGEARSIETGGKCISTSLDDSQGNEGECNAAIDHADKCCSETSSCGLELSEKMRIPISKKVLPILGTLAPVFLSFSDDSALSKNRHSHSLLSSSRFRS